MSYFCTGPIAVLEVAVVRVAPNIVLDHLDHHAIGLAWSFLAVQYRWSLIGSDACSSWVVILVEPLLGAASRGSTVQNLLPPYNKTEKTNQRSRKRCAAHGLTSNRYKCTAVSFPCEAFLLVFRPAPS